MEVITSLTFISALKMPGISPQSIPPTMPAMIAAIHCIAPGRSHMNPTYRAKNIPIVYCPEAPILNKPILKANPTARPVMRIGVAK